MIVWIVWPAIHVEWGLEPVERAGHPGGPVGGGREGGQGAGGGPGAGGAGGGGWSGAGSSC